MKTHLSLLNPGWLLATVLAVLLPLAAKAQVTPDWTSSQSGANGSMVAADAANNAWVAGTATATTTVRPMTCKRLTGRPRLARFRCCWR